MNVMVSTAGLALLAAALLCWFGQDTALAQSTPNAIEMAQAAPVPTPRAPAAAPRPPAAAPRPPGAASSPPGGTASVPSATPRAPSAAPRAPAAGSTISDVEVERTIAIWAQQMNMKPDQLIEVYARSGKNIDELKRHIRAYIAEKRRTEPWWQP